MKRFQYMSRDFECKMSMRIDSLHEMNELGKDGWELVSITPSHYDTHHIFIFKREIEETTL